jgi:hypothetical protein
MTKNKMQDAVLFVALGLLVLLILMNNISSYIDQNIWTRWALLYTFSILNGICVAYVFFRFYVRSYIPVLDMKSGVAFLGIVFGVYFAILQFDPMVDYYLWNNLTYLEVIISFILVIVFVFFIFVNTVFKQYLT